MSDRTYTRFTIPLSIIAIPDRATAVQHILNINADEFFAALVGPPPTDEGAGVDGLSLRTIDGCACLVHEDTDGNYGGASAEDALTSAGIPFILVHGAGHEYGPASTVFTGAESEIIRLDHDLNPIAGIRHAGGRVVVEEREIADYERYCRLRQVVLLYPALAA